MQNQPKTTPSPWRVTQPPSVSYAQRSRRDILVVGGSAGGLDALSRVVSQLPAGLPAALFVVLHTPAEMPSRAPELLARWGRLPAVHPRDGEMVQMGRIYVAPPGQHLLLQEGRVRLSLGPRENNARPAVDALFRTAAQTYRWRVAGVILSGALDDGTAGLFQVKLRGGVSIVQSPDDALVPDMPAAALRHVEIDYRLPAADIAPILIQLAHGRPHPRRNEPMSHDERSEEHVVSRGKQRWEQGEEPSGRSSVITCPDCGGVLWELAQDDLLRYRCHVDHVYSMDSLVARQADKAEEALWAAVRQLEERAMLMNRLAEHAQAHNGSAEDFHRRAANARQKAEAIRQVILEKDS